MKLREIDKKIDELRREVLELKELVRGKGT